MRGSPSIYEINAWVWCVTLTRKYGQTITLENVPDAELDGLASWGFDAVWLMGVWERSAAGRRIGLEHKGLRAQYDGALPDWTPDDVVGSPYAVRRYEVDPQLGGGAALAAIRGRLAERGLSLVLDFVPNHTATDHPWVHECPACFVQGDAGDLAEQAGAFFVAGAAGPGGAGSSAGGSAAAGSSAGGSAAAGSSAGGSAAAGSSAEALSGVGLSAAEGRGAIVAHGRDPYFPPWTDTAQVHAFSPELRRRVTGTLIDIASRCDAVRCDMAMLLTTAVFQRTWGDRAGPAPDVELWREVIGAVKARYPSFVFIAEVYWDMESEMLAQGFDLTYDKRLYDRLCHEGPEAVRAHLSAPVDYQSRQVRFIENHDEPRASIALGGGRGEAAAVLVATLPGAKLVHEGQLQGHRVKLPVQLARRPEEPADGECEAFYRGLFAEAAHPVYHHGDFSLWPVRAAWRENPSAGSLIAYTRRLGNERRLVVVNLSGEPAQGRIPLPELDVAGRRWRLDDVLDGARYDRDGDEMAGQGLFVDLAPFRAHVLRFCAATSAAVTAAALPVSASAAVTAAALPVSASAAVATVGLPMSAGAAVTAATVPVFASAPASLYLPQAFAERDIPLLHDLIDTHAFGTLTACDEGGVPVIAHLPFVLDRGRGPYGTLRAHIARANPIRRALERGAPLVAVFSGPHAYVSPGWYASRNDVPTWNYAVAHVHGTARLLDEAGLLALLARLAEVNEEGQPEPWSMAEVSAKRLGELLPAIVGFEIEIARIDGKFKLSQNRRQGDREGTIRGLSARGKPDDRALVALMTRGQS